MRTIKGPLDEHRQNPALRAEIQFFDAMAEADIPGSIIYNVNVGHQVDAFDWTFKGGRHAYEVKGGLHWIEDGRWYCQGRDGVVTEMPYTPVEQAMEVALAVSDALEKRLNGHKPWINPVLALVDMPEPVPAIVECANDHRVQMMWGPRNVAEQHRRLAEANPAYRPPSDLDMEAEAAAFERRLPPAGWAPSARGRRGAAAHGKRNANAPATGPAAEDPAPTGPAASPASVTIHIHIHNHGTVVIPLPGQPLPPGTPDDALIVIPPAEPGTDPLEPADDDDPGPAFR